MDGWNYSFWVQLCSKNKRLELEKLSTSGHIYYANHLAQGLCWNKKVSTCLRISSSNRLIVTSTYNDEDPIITNTKPRLTSIGLSCVHKLSPLHHHIYMVINCNFLSRVQVGSWSYNI